MCSTSLGLFLPDMNFFSYWAVLRRHPAVICGATFVKPFLALWVVTGTICISSIFLALHLSLFALSCSVHLELCSVPLLLLFVVYLSCLSILPHTTPVHPRFLHREVAPVSCTILDSSGCSLIPSYFEWPWCLPVKDQSLRRVCTEVSPKRCLLLNWIKMLCNASIKYECESQPC